MDPLLSVVIPAYNEAGYIENCLASIRAQKTSVPYEVIVVDNASTDATAAIARAHGAFVVTEDQKGVCFARQTGLLAARGSVVVSADADTSYPPDWLDHIAQSFADERVVAVAGPARFAGSPAWALAWTSFLFGWVRAWTRVFGRLPYASACNLAFRRAAFSGYDTRLTQGGDELAVVRALKGKGSMVFDSTNLAVTSGRRVARGFLYNVVFTLLVLYLFEYTMSRLMNRSVFGSYPCFRGDQASRQGFRLALGIAGGVGLLLGVAFVLREPDAFYGHAAHIWRSLIH